MKRFLHCTIALALLCSSVPAWAAAPITVAVTSFRNAAPQGAQRVPILSLRISVPCDEAATIASITLEHRGLGDTADIRAMYISSGGRRISRAIRSFRGQRIDIPLRSFSIAPCKQAVLDVLTDFSVDAAPEGQHVFIVQSIDAGDRAVTARASTPASTGVRTGQSVGVVTVESLPLLLPVRYGARRTVARMRLRAGERDQRLLSILLTNDGSARNGDLQNLFVRRSNGKTITDIAPTLEGDHVGLSFTQPFVLRRNEEILLELVADVRASSRRTIRFSVEEEADLRVEPCTGRRTCLEAH